MVQEKKMTVGVVASSNSVLALCVSQQRFGMSLDPLTLRLFMKLKQQQGALPLISEAISAAMLSQQQLEHCREVIVQGAGCVLSCRGVRQNPVHAKPDALRKQKGK